MWRCFSQLFLTKLYKVSNFFSLLHVFEYFYFYKSARLFLRTRFISKAEKIHILSKLLFLIFTHWFSSHFFFLRFFLLEKTFIFDAKFISDGNLLGIYFLNFFTRSFGSKITFENFLESLVVSILQVRTVIGKIFYVLYNRYFVCVYIYGSFIDKLRGLALVHRTKAKRASNLGFFEFKQHPDYYSLVSGL